MNPLKELQALFQNAADGQLPAVMPPAAQSLLDRIGNRTAQTAALVMMTGATFLAHPVEAKAQLGRTDSVLIGGAIGMLLGHSKGHEVEGAILGGVAGAAIQSAVAGTPDRGTMIGVGVGAGAGYALGRNPRERVVYAVSGAALAGVVGHQIDLQRQDGFRPGVPVGVVYGQPPVAVYQQPAAPVYYQPAPPPVAVYQQPQIVEFYQPPVVAYPVQGFRSGPNPNDWRPGQPGLGHWVQDPRMQEHREGRHEEHREGHEVRPAAPKDTVHHQQTPSDHSPGSLTRPSKDSLKEGAKALSAAAHEAHLAGRDGPSPSH